MVLKRSLSLAKNYVVAPALGLNSPATYWYLPDPPNVRSKQDFERYKNPEVSPFYLIDYRSRTRFRFQSADGIIRLPYPAPLGAQINPEAAFQYALGWHDCYLIDATSDSQVRFVDYADYFASRQSADGDFSYMFDWYENRAPWHSALAQSRGASVLLRAFMLTKHERYRKAALKALDRFDVDCEAGGYRAVFAPTGSVYFEEYPAQKNAVINGFMASLFGLYEIGYWLDDLRCREMFVHGIESLEQMLPHYTLSWWTLYDQDVQDAGKNVHSPRYQIMVIGYLQVLAMLSGSPIIAEYASRWETLNTRKNRARAYVSKFIRKVVYR